ncbi:MAG: flagellar basal body-associated FliL family protein [bacterium]
MKKFLLPVLLAMLGLGIGIGAGKFLQPAPVEHEVVEAVPIDPALTPEYVKLANQFVVPVMQKGKVSAMVILSLSLEVKPGTTQEVYNIEPKLRDSFLQVMFDHANSGGFSGSYTDGANLLMLRKALLEAARVVMQDSVSDVLITDIVRQDS